VAALSRIGAVAVLLSPATPDELLARALELGEAAILVVDPDAAARARVALTGTILVLGGAGEVPWQPGERRVLPGGVVDLEAIDPEAVVLPAWYRPDPGRARDLAMVFVSSGKHEPPRAVRITHRRWAFSALGAAAAATLTTRDTVYCCLPLHHPSGTLVATGSALISGARLALASRRPTAGTAAAPPGARDLFDLPEGFVADTFWDEVRRYGVTVVYYAGEMCRRLVDAAPVLGEANHPVRLFAGSGMRRDVWRRVVDRFGPVGVLEMYASTEASMVLANARGKKLGSVGRPLPGSPDVAIAAWSASDDAFVRDGAGHLVHARLDEPGMLVARLSETAELAHIDPKRLLRDAFTPGDRWFVTGDFFRVDAEGDYWFVDRQRQMIPTRHGLVASTRIEDALYEAPGVALCAASSRPEPGDAAHRFPVAALQLRPGAALDLDALSRAVTGLPEYARPRRLRIVDSLAVTDGFRPIKPALDELDLADGPSVLAWDARTQRWHPTQPPADTASARAAVHPSPPP
ncbi:MAG TPA: AMP-binding protein, partial [Kofleriaceae bacterium]|nr:AMP-binding protein [Kofleriaceae bacterium]